jgi:hypothetical protein
MTCVDAEIRHSLAALGPSALRELRVLMMGTSEDRAAFLRRLMAQSPTPGSDALAELIAICDLDEAARVTVLRGIRDQER